MSLRIRRKAVTSALMAATLARASVNSSFLEAMAREEREVGLDIFFPLKIYLFINLWMEYIITGNNVKHYLDT
jgi:hypothetical protein